MMNTVTQSLLISSLDILWRDSIYMHEHLLANVTWRFLVADGNILGYLGHLNHRPSIKCVASCSVAPGVSSEALVAKSFVLGCISVHGENIRPLARCDTMVLHKLNNVTSY